MSGQRQGRPRLAYAVSEVLAPIPVALVMTAAVALASSASIAAGLGWAALAWLFVGVIPGGIVYVGVRSGRLGGRHIPDRSQRLVPMALAGGSLLVGVLVLVLLGAPRDLVALLLSQVAAVGVGLAVTARWKASIHTAGVAGAVTVLVIVVGPWGLLATPAVALVAWSRVTLGAHSWAQVGAGAALGALVGGGVFALVR